MISIELQSAAYANSKFESCKYFKTNDKRITDFDKIKSAYEDGIELAYRWIHPKVRLPSKQGHYLVKVKNSFPKNCDVVIAEFYEDNQTFYSESSDNPIDDVLFWRPITVSKGCI